MENSKFKKIFGDSQRKVLELTKKIGWVWFYNLHQKEVVNCAGKLLKIYKKADRKTVLIACCLHDISKYRLKSIKNLNKTHKNHHIESAKIAGQFLDKYKLKKEEIDKIKNAILRHRNSPPYKAKTLEEKIVAVADTLSHFQNIFYLTHFKFYPNHSLEEMVKNNLTKIKRDWRDLGLLPKARKLVETEYKVIKNLLENYEK